MALFTIGDLHLSLGCDKPMDIFPGWSNYVARLEENWRREVSIEDTVVLAGDTSWAMRLEDTLADFQFIDDLPGRKLLLKGNHDYWWGTVNKMENFLQTNDLKTLYFLHNNCYSEEEMMLCGTRSWLFESGEALDAKLAKREAGRLRASLAAAKKQFPEREKVVFLHYPPVYGEDASPEIIALMREYGVRRCYYGHLHGESIRRAVQGERNGIRYQLVSADSMAFCPLRIEKEQW